MKVLVEPKGSKITCELDASLEWLPECRVALRYTGNFLYGMHPLKTMVANHGDYKLYNLGESDPISLSPSNTVFDLSGDGPEADLTWKVFALGPLNADLRVDFVMGQILSLPNYFTDNRVGVKGTGAQTALCYSLKVPFGDWLFELSSHLLTSDYLKKMKSGNHPHTVTHSVRLTKKGHTSFLLNETESAIQNFDLLLSFACGKRISIGNLAGIDEDENYHPYLLGFPRNAPGVPIKFHQWWDFDRNASALEEIAEGFSSLLTHGAWGNHLRGIIYMYLEANQKDRPTTATDTGVALSQMALEMISWVYLVHDKKAFTEKDFEDISAAGKIRAALALMGIPLELPDKIKSRMKRGVDKNPDGPFLITSARNDFVHPKEKNRFDVPFYDVWNLAQWYVELMLLRLCGYNGNHRNRANGNRVQKVPWNSL